MRVGLSCYDISASELVALGVAAEAAGFDSVWLGEHVVLPVDYGSEHPTTGDTAHQHHTGPIVDPSTTLVDPLVALSAVAAATSSLRLATGIYLLPLRPPLVTARMTATLADVSGGRFMLGVGSGWLEEEFAAVGVPFHERRARYEESIAILRQAWSGKPFAHDGTYWRFGRVQVSTSPVEVPLVLGGNTEAALRRAAAVADGWFAWGTPSFEDAVVLRRRLLELRDELGRHEPFPMHVRVASPDVPLDAYEAAGFASVLVWADQVWPGSSSPGGAAAAAATLAEAGSRLGLTPPEVSS